MLAVPVEATKLKEGAKKKKKSLTPQLAENVKIFGVLRAKATRKT